MTTCTTTQFPQTGYSGRYAVFAAQAGTLATGLEQSLVSVRPRALVLGRRSLRPRTAFPAAGRFNAHRVSLYTGRCADAIRYMSSMVSLTCVDGCSSPVRPALVLVMDRVSLAPIRATISTGLV
jgi:hypothetical protein